MESINPFCCWGGTYVSFERGQKGTSAPSRGHKNSKQAGHRPGVERRKCLRLNLKKKEDQKQTAYRGTQNGDNPNQQVPPPANYLDTWSGVLKCGGVDCLGVAGVEPEEQESRAPISHVKEWRRKSARRAGRCNAHQCTKFRKLRQGEHFLSLA